MFVSKNFTRPVDFLIRSPWGFNQWIMYCRLDGPWASNMGINDWCDPSLGVHEMPDGTRYSCGFELEDIEEYVEPQLVIAAELVALQF